MTKIRVLHSEPVCLWLLAIMLVAALTLPARADETKQHDERGYSLYVEGHYRQAIDEYEAAYALRPRPILLFNIAQSYRKLHDGDKARDYYRRYQEQESSPTLEIRRTIEAALVELRPPAPPPPVPQPSSPPLPTLADLRTPPPFVNSPAATAAANAALQSALVRPAPKPLYRRPWFWGVLASSVCVAVVGTVLVTVAASTPSTPHPYPIDRPFASRVK